MLNASGGTTMTTPTLAGAPYRMLLAQSVTSSWDLDGSAMPAVQSTYQYDSYGNPTQIVTATPDGALPSPLSIEPPPSR